MSTFFVHLPVLVPQQLVSFPSIHPRVSRYPSLADWFLLWVPQFSSPAPVFKARSLAPCNQCQAREKSRVQILSAFGFVIRFLSRTSLQMWLIRPARMKILTHKKTLQILKQKQSQVSFRNHSKTTVKIVYLVKHFFLSLDNLSWAANNFFLSWKDIYPTKTPSLWDKTKFWSDNTQKGWTLYPSNYRAYSLYCDDPWKRWIKRNILRLFLKLLCYLSGKTEDILRSCERNLQCPSQYCFATHEIREFVVIISTNFHHVRT